MADKNSWLTRKMISYGHLFFSILLLINISPAYSTETKKDNTILGAVDVLTVSKEKFTLQGWAGALRTGDAIRTIEVTLNDRTFYKADFETIERYPRPDVNKALERDDWVKPGWRLTTTIPESLQTETYNVRVSATSTNGAVSSLPVSDAAKQFSYKKPSLSDKLKSYKVPTLAFAGFALLLYLFLTSDKLSARLLARTKNLIHPAAIFSVGMIITFLVLLALGLTGSSFGIGVKQTSFIKSNPKVLWGEEQPIRSDEWLVLTPNAIAQVNHVPPFPIVNSNLGEDGQNMLIIGMAGVPVAHISQFVKPATWGYYLFDLKRALSWNWLFPIFACLSALWAVLCNLNPGYWRHNFVAALSFSTAAYVVAWSNWPAYTVFFPCIVYLAFINILKAKKASYLVFLSTILGLAFAGFVLVLYPPWQISLSYVFIAITIGKLIKDKLYTRFGLTHLIAYSWALGVAIIVLYAWWSDARIAINAMQNTVYPGLRTTLPGGNAAFEFLIRGYTNLETLKGLSSPFSNQSEIASFYYMLLPLMTIFLIRAYQKHVSAIEISLAIAILFILYFMFVGIPIPLAEYSLWGRVPEKRADLALGFACIVLTALLVTRRHNDGTPAVRHLNIVASVCTVTWVLLTYNTVLHLDDSIIATFERSSKIFVFGITLISGFLLARGSIRSYFVVILLLSTATTYNFNPIVAAPNHVEIRSAAIAERKSSMQADRILVLESSTPSMYLLASGAKVLSGIFYYPQTSIWKQLDPDSKSINIYNRYQHLRFHTGTELDGGKTFSLANPGTDRVDVSIAPKAFDFSKLSATILVAPAAETELQSNPSLVHLKTEDGWMWFKINH